MCEAKVCDADKQKIKEILKEVFNDIDKDKSGFLDQSELERVIKAFVEHPDCPADCKAECGTPAKIKKCCEDFMKAVDTSGDKKISLDEFLKFFKCCD